MPISYTVYGCRFKCGKRHSRSRRHIELHEARCWYNSDSRSCKTCRFERYYADSSGFSFSGGWHDEPEWWVRECTLSSAETEALIDAVYQQFPNGEPEHGDPIPPVVGCQFWQLRRSYDSAPAPAPGDGAGQEASDAP